MDTCGVASGHTFRAADDVQDRPAGSVLLLGGTGFVGMMLLTRLLSQDDRRIFALVRASDDEAAQLRLEQTLRCLFGEHEPFAGRVIAVRGDVTMPRLGLARAQADWLASEVDCIVHGAASVSFDKPLADSRRANVRGTALALEFAEQAHARGGLHRFAYISTAYVAGTHDGVFSEHQLELGQRFRNPYEQSKFEAERLVRDWRNRVPITVFRPSIIVGERSTGWTASFNVLYWPLRAFVRGTYLALPARRDAPVDVVPVDYVADAILTLTDAQEAQGRTYHLTAGEHTTTVGEVVDLATKHLRRAPPLLLPPRTYRRLVHPVLIRGTRNERRRAALRRSEVFFPYFAANVTYDNHKAATALARHGIRPAPLRDYFGRLVEYALSSDWGHTPVPRHALIGNPTKALAQTPA